MKILVVLGGGRPNGNTAQLANAFMEGAKSAGHDLKLLNLNQVTVQGCIGCNVCRYRKPCIIKDDWNGIVPDFDWAEMIVFASPLYFWTISAKLKAFIERFYNIAEQDDDPPLGRYEKYPKKKSALLMTAADNFFWTFSQAVSYYQFAVVNYIGFEDCGMVLAGGCGESMGKPNITATDHLNRAYEFGRGI